MSLFHAEDISIRFGGIRAVDAVSFDVEPGEVFAIIGPNGAGKTTIFNLISRIYNPTSGRLVFNERDITATPLITLPAWVSPAPSRTSNCSPTLRCCRTC
jgi:branched-chain amino acid transport system ATP-binding protein